VLDKLFAVGTDGEEVDIHGFKIIKKKKGSGRAKPMHVDVFQRDYESERHNRFSSLVQPDLLSNDREHDVTLVQPPTNAHQAPTSPNSSLRAPHAAGKSVGGGRRGGAGPFATTGKNIGNIHEQSVPDNRSGQCFKEESSLGLTTKQVGKDLGRPCASGTENGGTTNTCKRSYPCQYACTGTSAKGDCDQQADNEPQNSGSLRADQGCYHGGPGGGGCVPCAEKSKSKIQVPVPVPVPAQCPEKKNQQKIRFDDDDSRPHPTE
jgi:hypothetical protein